MREREKERKRERKREADRKIVSFVLISQHAKDRRFSHHVRKGKEMVEVR